MENVNEIINIGISKIQIMIHFGVALVAGIMKGVNRINTGDFNIIRTIADGAIGSFTGVMSGFLCLNFSVPIYLTLFIVSLSGWLGGNLINFFGYLGKKMLAKSAGVTATVEEEIKHSELVNRGGKGEKGEKGEKG